MGAHGAARPARRGGRRARPRLSLLRAFARRPLGSRDRHDGAARRPVAAGAPGARRGLRQRAGGAAPPRRRARQRPERHRDARPLALAGAARRRSRRLRGARAASSSRPRSRCARPCRSRFRRRLPRSPPRHRSRRSRRTPAPPFRRRRSPGWSSATATARSCARRCSPAPTCRSRSGRRSPPPCRRACRASSPAAAGSRPSAPSASSARRARRRRSPCPRPPSAATSPRLVHHLRRTGQLTPALILRALLSRSMGFAEAAFADLSGLAAGRGRRRCCGTGAARASRRSTAKAGLPREPAAGVRGGALRAAREWAGRSRCRRRAARRA